MFVLTAWTNWSNFTEFDAVGSKTAILCEMLHNDGHSPIQGHRFW